MVPHKEAQHLCQKTRVILLTHIFRASNSHIYWDIEGLQFPLKKSLLKFVVFFRNIPLHLKHAIFLYTVSFLGGSE